MANETQKSNEKQTRFKPRKPAMYNVVMHNDDETTMEFVVDVLRIIFHMQEAKANIVMMKVHCEGKAVVGTYTKDIARSKADMAMQLARRHGYPLLLTIEQA